MVDRSKISDGVLAILDKVMSFGISEVDAEVITDCIINKKSCSWVNNDEVNEKILRNLNEYILANNFNLLIKVDAVPTRNKFVWEIKYKK